MIAAGVNPCHFQPFIGVDAHNNMFGRSKAASHVKWWLQAGYRPEELLVIDFKSLIADPRGTVDRTLQFLGMSRTEGLEESVEPTEVEALFALRMNGPNPWDNSDFQTARHGVDTSSNVSAFEKALLEVHDGGSNAAFAATIAARRDLVAPQLRHPHGAGARVILAHAELRQFNPDTVTADSIDAVTELLGGAEWDHDVELDAIQRMGVQTLRPPPPKPNKKSY